MLPGPAGYMCCAMGKPGNSKHVVFQETYVTMRSRLRCTATVHVGNEVARSMKTKWPTLLWPRRLHLTVIFLWENSNPPGFLVFRDFIKIVDANWHKEYLNCFVRIQKMLFSRGPLVYFYFSISRTFHCIKSTSTK